MSKAHLFMFLRLLEGKGSFNSSAKTIKLEFLPVVFLRSVLEVETILGKLLSPIIDNTL